MDRTVNQTIHVPCENWRPFSRNSVGRTLRDYILDSQASALPPFQLSTHLLVCNEREMTVVPAMCNGGGSARSCLAFQQYTSLIIRLSIILGGALWNKAQAANYLDTVSRKMLTIPTLLVFAFNMVRDLFQQTSYQSLCGR